MENSTRKITIHLSQFTNPSVKMFNLFGLKIINQSFVTTTKHKMCAWISILSVTALYIQSIMFIIKHNGEDGMFLKFTYSFSCICFASMAVLKVFVIFIQKRELVEEIFEMLDVSYPKSNVDQENLGLRKWLKLLKLQSWCYGILMILLGFFMTFSALLVPFFMWYPFEIDGTSPIVFEISYFYSACCTFSCVLVFLGIAFLQLSHNSLHGI